MLRKKASKKMNDEAWIKEGMILLGLSIEKTLVAEQEALTWWHRMLSRA